MIAVWTVVTVAGFALATWALLSLPEGTDVMPVPVVERNRVTDGAYQWPWMKHPMYVGNVMFVSGLAGLNGGRWGGVFGALSVAFLAGMLMQYWAGLEKKR